MKSNDKFRLEEIKKRWREEPDDNMVFKAANQDIEEYPPEILAIIKEEAERRNAIQTVPNNQEAQCSNTEKRKGMPIRRKYLVLSVVFLVVAVCSGYSAYSTHMGRSYMGYSRGKVGSQTDKETVEYLEALSRLGYSSLSPYAEMAREELQAKERKVTLLFLCAVTTGVLGVAFLFHGIKFTREASEPPPNSGDNNMPCIQT